MMVEAVEAALRHTWPDLRWTVSRMAHVDALEIVATQPFPRRRRTLIAYAKTTLDGLVMCRGREAVALAIAAEGQALAYEVAEQVRELAIPADAPDDRVIKNVRVGC